METKLISGTALSARLREDLKKETAALPKPPKLAVILVGDDPASVIYVTRKKKQAESVGIEMDLYHLSPVVTQDALVAFIQDLNQDERVDAILVQQPVPKHLDADLILQTVAPEKDPDGLTSDNLGRLFSGHPRLIPCTPLACMALIREAGVNTDGLHAVIVGRSRLVGKPLAQLLLDAQCTVTLAHSHTKNLAQLTQTADILIAATGKAGLITAEHVKKGAVVIDVGISRTEDGKIAGDVLAEQVKGIASALTPVPGGVGPMTITMLLHNVIQIAKKKKQPT